MKAVDKRTQTRTAKQQSLHSIELLISRVLFWGAFVSIAVAAAGLLTNIFRGGLPGNLRDQLHHQTASASTTFTSVPQLIAAVRGGSNPLAITAAGLVLLLMVPVISVALLIPAFLKQHDYRYAIIAGFILFILLFSLISGSV